MVVWGCIVSLHLPLCATNPFRMKAMAAYTIPVNQTTTHSIDLQPFGSISNVRGIDVTATVIQQSDDALVRLIVEDYDGSEYLLLESYRMINDMDTVQFTNYCEETAVLPAIEPKILRVIVKDATVSIHDLHYALMQRANQAPSDLATSDKANQAFAIAEKINRYNEKHHLLWRADVTDLARLSYSERKILLGMESDSAFCPGWEYYSRGIFQMGKGHDHDHSNTNSPYVSIFDWRNRHGINWMTPSKKQYDSNWCVFFATAGVLEGLTNLYYNRQLDLSLCVPEMALYNKTPPYTWPEKYRHGDTLSSAANYVVNHGVSDSLTIPFIPSVNAYTGTPSRDNYNELIRLNSYNRVIPGYSGSIPCSTFSQIKKAVIEKGPLLTALTNTTFSHAMALIGYKTIENGEHIVISDSCNIDIDINDSIYSDYIGKTVWIFKNSGGPADGWKHDGCMYIIVDKDYVMENPIYFSYPLYSENYDSSDIQVTDNDGDGYYFWGLGPKPSGYSWVPDEPDGDDSDYSKGPMDEYGYLIDNNPDSLNVIYINEDTEYGGLDYFHRHIVVQNAASLSLTGTGTFYQGVTITLNSGCTLILDGGSYEGASFDIKPGAKVKITHNAYTKLLQNGNIVIPLGAELEYTSGTIK